MSLRATLEKILGLLAKNPTAEHQSSLKAFVFKLETAATAFENALAQATVENSVSYARLAGLLSDPAKKKTTTLAWANNHLRRLNAEELSGKSLTPAAKAQFLLRVLTVNGADEIISELSRTEEEKLQDEFARIAKLSKPQAEGALDEFKGEKLERFCSANGVPVIKKKTGKTGKAPLDKKKTYENILGALVGFRERQKL
jgi:tellurite resistance protein